MLFNFWRRYPKRKPKKSGWYLCTVGVWDGEDRERFIIQKLYFLDRENRWIDSNRQSVFDGYKVYISGRAPIEENRMHSDTMCVRTDDVRAWKVLPKCWGPRKWRNK